MKQCEVYKLKEGKRIINGYGDYYYIDSFYPRLNKDGESTIITEFVIIGIDIENMELSQLFNRYVVTIDTFKELFEEVPVMTQDEVMKKSRELREGCEYEQ